MVKPLRRKKGVVGREEVARFLCSLCGIGQDNYRRLP